jgi:EpsI family protein
MLVKKGDAKQVVYYWFQQRGRMMANEYLMKWYLFTDAVLLNRTDGALVRLTTRVYPGEEEEAADLRLKTFMKQITPILPDYLPN